jgi:hypothetical protein
MMCCDASGECFWYGGIALAVPKRDTMRALNYVGSQRRFCRSTSAYKIYVNKLCKQCVIFVLLSVHRRGISSSPDISLDKGTLNVARSEALFLAPLIDIPSTTFYISIYPEVFKYSRG